MTFSSLLPWTALMPEFVLGLSSLCLLLIGAFSGDKAARAITVMSMVLCGLTIAIICGQLTGAGVGAHMMLPDGQYGVSLLTAVIKIMVLIAAMLSLLIAPAYMKKVQIERPEYPVLIILSVVGMMLMVSASNFLMLYLGLELQGLALYVLASFRRDYAKSTEAGLKYFFLGALASGFLLYGISLIYGFTGTMDFARVAEFLSAGSAGLGVKIGLLFILAAIAFKISAAPFHMWTPDVYEGAPTSITAFFSVAPKVAALGLLMHVLYGPLAPLAASWKPLVAGLAFLSMIVGAFGAIGQNNIKRLLAYSSIGHVGFALMALTGGFVDGGQAVLLYLFFYVIMSIGAFAVVLLMQRGGCMVEEISDLAGVSRNNPGLAAAMAIIMFSMAGIPPMVGFFTKLYVFMAAIHAGMIGLAVVGAVSSVVGAFYYIRVIKVMYFDEPVMPLDVVTDDAGAASAVVMSSVLTLAGVAVITPLAIIAKLALDGIAP